MICVPIKNSDPKGVLKLYKKAQNVADLVEICFDRIHPPQTDEFLTLIFKSKTKPIIYKFEGNEESLFKILSCQIDYIDLDITTPISLIKKIKKQSPKLKIIISYHDFEATKSLKSLQQLSQKIIKKGPDIVKIATTAKTINDCFKIFSLLEFLRSKKQKAICLCMGQAGKLTRIAGHLFGNYLMYCPLDKKQITASGQLTVKELCHLRSAL